VNPSSSKATASELLKQLPGEATTQWPNGVRSVAGLRHGTMTVKLFAPDGGPDRQSPHLQDEVYFVIAGSGTFVLDGHRHAFEPGTAFFVRAGVIHRFEDFTPDFVTWVVFWGPEGGEPG
jgi:mannose-6-phosphate isomerase-like protein (cupin superfamily)